MSRTGLRTGQGVAFAGSCPSLLKDHLGLAVAEERRRRAPEQITNLLKQLVKALRNGDIKAVDLEIAPEEKVAAFVPADKPGTGWFSSRQRKPSDTPTLVRLPVQKVLKALHEAINKQAAA